MKEVIVVIIFILILLFWYHYNSPVDVVITWVDGEDAEWNRTRDKYKKDKQDNRNVRFKNVNELYLCLKGITTYLPWVRNIYLVTARPQRPTYLTKEFPNVKVVHHDEIYTDQSCLPTFNSLSIETQLHNIPGLSENFIYFNDDCFIGKPLPKSFFFTEFGRPIHYNRYLLNKYVIQTYSKMRNVKRPLSAPIHLTYATSKTLFKKAWQLLPNELRKTSKNRFRDVKDVWILAITYQLGNVHRYISPKEIMYSLMSKPKAAKLIKSYVNDDINPSLICINNIDSSNEYHMELWNAFSKKYYKSCVT